MEQRERLVECLAIVGVFRRHDEDGQKLSRARAWSHLAGADDKAGGLKFFEDRADGCVLAVELLTGEAASFLAVHFVSPRIHPSSTVISRASANATMVGTISSRIAFVIAHNRLFRCTKDERAVVYTSGKSLLLPKPRDV